MASIPNRSYIIFFIGLFTISLSILLIASTAETPVPAWVGYLDGGIVTLIVFTGIMIHRRHKNMLRYATSYQIAVYLFLSILPHAINLWKTKSFQ